MSIKKDLKNRWIAEQTEIGLEVIFGIKLNSPFGITAKGFQDFRGVSMSEVHRPENVTLSDLDFSYLHGDRIIYANSVVRNCKFDNVTLTWGDYQSFFQNVSFVSAKLKGSGFGGGNGSQYEKCDFSNADLRGSSGAGKIEFVDCLFSKTKWNNCLIGEVEFEKCKFIGKMEKVIFGSRVGGYFNECDFVELSFVDCSFYNCKFSSCKFSDNTLIFTNWPRTLSRFRSSLHGISDSDILRKFKVWISVWEDDIDSTPQNIISKEDLIKQIGVAPGQKMFEIFKEIFYKTKQGT